MPRRTLVAAVVVALFLGAGLAGIAIPPPPEPLPAAGDRPFPTAAPAADERSDAARREADHEDATSGATAFLLGGDARAGPDASAGIWRLDVGQIWVGRWVVDAGFGSVERDLALLRDAGVTPQIQWYYWSHDIAPSAIEHGANGKSVAEWDALAAELARRAAAVMGDREVLVVVETEFNLNGVETWSPFNDHLERQYAIFREHLPGARLVLGFGAWKEWHYPVFAPAAADADYVGFQMMRGATRETLEELRAVPDDAAMRVRLLADLFGKPVLLYDLALATYDGWEDEVAAVYARLADDLPALRDAGLAGLVLRGVRDDPQAPRWEWYGPAERTFGVLRADGSPKAAWEPWLCLAAAARA